MALTASRQSPGALPPYQAPRWLPDGHSQTIWPALCAPRAAVVYRRERWDTPDGDFIEVDFAVDGAVPDDAPLLVLFHGLEGSSQSHYSRAIMAAANRHGWRGAVAHFRGCGSEPNRLARAYHSGDSDEIDWVLRQMKTRHAPGTDLYAAGVSLGGNALLKWAGERGSDAGRVVRAVAGVSAPQDLEAGARALSSGFSLLYSANFMKTLKRKALDKLDRYPGLFDADAVARARTFYDFDDLVTAPLHGFRDCYDYWARSSCRGFLGQVQVPALVINALNDPFVPASALAPPDQVSSAVRLEYPAGGGHVGFLTGGFPGNMDWLGQRLIGFFEHG